MNFPSSSPQDAAPTTTRLAYFLGGVIAGALVGGTVGYLAHDLLREDSTPTLGSEEQWAPRPLDTSLSPWLDEANEGTTVPTNVPAALPSAGGVPDNAPSAADGTAPSTTEIDWRNSGDDPSPEHPTERDLFPGGTRLDPNSNTEFDAPEP